MKDYCTNDFQRKNFILNFKVEANRIKIFYADGTIEEKKLDLKTIKWILTQMRKQIINYESEYKKNKESISKIKKLIKVNRFFSVIYTLLIILLLTNTSILSIPPILLDAYLILSSLRSNKVYKTTISKLEPTVADYEKNLFFVDHSEEFKNAAISYEGLKHSSLSIINTINKGLSVESLLKNGDNIDSSIHDIISFKSGNDEATKKLKDSGFKDIGDITYPIFNEGSIETIPIEDLSTFQTKNKGGKGPVLVKTMKIK